MNHLCDFWNCQESGQDSSVAEDSESGAKTFTNEESISEVIRDCTKNHSGWHSLTQLWLTGSGDIYLRDKSQGKHLRHRNTRGMGAKLPPLESRCRVFRNSQISVTDGRWRETSHMILQLWELCCSQCALIRELTFCRLL